MSQRKDLPEKDLPEHNRVASDHDDRKNDDIDLIEIKTIKDMTQLTIINILAKYVSIDGEALEKVSDC